MSLVTILYINKSEPVKENIDRELNWYDTIKKEMQVFQGGKLTFKYKEDDYLVKMKEEERIKNNIKSNYRLLPVVEELEITNYNKSNKVSNKNKVEKWFNSYINYTDEDITISNKNDIEIDFDVPEKEVENFLDACERQGFSYEKKA